MCERSPSAGQQSSWEGEISHAKISSHFAFKVPKKTHVHQVCPACSHGALMARSLSKFAPLSDSRFTGQLVLFACKAGAESVTCNCIGERTKTYALCEPIGVTSFNFA